MGILGGSFFTLIWLLAVVQSQHLCRDLSPAFPVPLWPDGAARLKAAFSSIEKKLAKTISNPEYDSASYSIELTSNTETLWSHFHTAKARNQTRPGTKKVDEDSLYRIASITKTFTVLGILHQHDAGNLSLDDPINKYVSGLKGDLPWKDTTLRILASQLSGLPREFAQGDIINNVQDPTAIGLPPATKENVPACDEYNNFIPCNRTDLLDTLKGLKPLYAPNFKSTYSNIAFELLGLALENVTELDYKTYMKQAIFDPLEMSSTTLDTPSDDHAVLPVLVSEENYWDVDAGIQNPTGGIYSSTSDMSKYLRYILTHFNTVATGVNWLLPASWSEGVRSFYGMPFEIFRTEKALKTSNRPVTFITKGGGLPGYYSKIYIMPEYGLGITVLTGGEPYLLDEIEKIVTVDVVRAAEAAIWDDIKEKYDGSYLPHGTDLNSSLVLSSSASGGLVIDDWISNGTAIWRDVILSFVPEKYLNTIPGWRVQLVPTLLYKDEENQKGEIWRFAPIPENPRSPEDSDDVWGDFCSTDVDNSRYAGMPVNEFVFWHDEGVVELPAWKIKFKAQRGAQRLGGLVVQG